MKREKSVIGTDLRVLLETSRGFAYMIEIYLISFHSVRTDEENIVTAHNPRVVGIACGGCRLSHLQELLSEIAISR